MWIKIICPKLYGKRLKLKSEELFIILYDAGLFAEATIRVVVGPFFAGNNRPMV